MNGATTRDAPVTVIRPERGWPSIEWRELWAFRDLVITLAERDLKLRYRQTVLGVAWVILQPLIGAGVFAFVFGRVAGLPSEGVPYFAFAFAGMLGWGLFLNTFTRSSLSLVAHSQLIAKVYFPRMALPLSATFSALADFSVGMGFLVLLLALYRIVPGAQLLLLPLWMALTMLLAIGAGLIAGALTVRYRDVAHVMPVMTQFLLYATPVAYAVSAVPENLRGLIYLNPLSALLEGYRWSLIDTAAPAWDAVLYSATMAVALFLAGVMTFAALQRRFADVI